MHLETFASSDEATVRQVRDLLDEAERHDDHVALSDAKRLQFARRRAERFTAFVARERPDGPVVAYAHLVRGHRRWDVEVVVAPGVRGRRADEPMLTRSVEHVAGRGGGELHYWTLHPSADDESRLAALGFAATGTLLQMRRPLPAGLPQPVWPDGLRLRAFERGRDEDEWLAVNHLAFDTHPDQGGWDREQLEMRMDEPWFDPEGFLIAQDAEGMAGFCWTKVHERQRLGEIYVIAAHPSRQGKGLGRSLVLAGLHHLASRGLPTGMLYTDAANEAAVHLYDGLSFEVHHRHVTFSRGVGASQTA